MLGEATGGGTTTPGGTPAVAPTIQTSEPQLRRSPSVQLLAAYYCPQVVDNPIVRIGCAAALGPVPGPDQLSFEFGLTVMAKNPNNIPIPALDVLLALTLFQGQDAEGLGAICVSLCGQADPNCNGAPRPGACSAKGQGIRTLDDFASRIPGLIAGLATGQVQDELRKSTIAAGGDLRVDLTFAMGIDQALRVIQKVARRFVDDFMNGRQSDLAIPVSASGTVFVQLPAIGPVGVGFGPIASTWQIPRKF
jgi:hypothetical protein